MNFCNVDDCCYSSENRKSVMWAGEGGCYVRGRTYPLEKFKYINVLSTCIFCIFKQFWITQFNKESCLIFRVYCVYCLLLKSQIVFYIYCLVTKDLLYFIVSILDRSNNYFSSYIHFKSEVYIIIYTLQIWSVFNFTDSDYFPTSKWRSDLPLSSSPYISVPLVQNWQSDLYLSV